MNNSNENQTTKARLPRGIRNNNPLNIRITLHQKAGRDRWLGMCEEQKDKAFCQFKEMKYGWRAAFILLTRNYYYVHHLHTVRGIISRWAPSDDGNNTAAYVKTVCEKMGVHPDAPLPEPHRYPGIWQKLAVAMAIVEVGVEGLDYFEMLEGYDLCRDFAKANVAGKIG